MNFKSKKKRKQVRKKVAPQDRRTKSYLIDVTPRKGRKDKDPFTIPVFHVYDERAAANALEKQANIQRGSLYIKPSYSVVGHSYN